MYWKFSSGFTLVELMIVILVIGILAVTSVPAYNEYKTKAKLAEAYSILGTMERHEITYYNQYNEFYNVNSLNPALIDNSMSIETSSSWTTIGYPAPVGSHVWFSYNLLAAKTNASGTSYGPGPTGASPSGSTNFQPIGQSHGVIIGFQGAIGTDCNNTDASFASLGAVAQANYDVVFLVAVANLDGEITDKCTSVTRMIESSTASEKKPNSPAGFILINYGK